MARMGKFIAAGVAIAILAPATAAADDQAVYDLWHTTHPRFVKLRHDFEKAERHWENSSYKDPGPAHRAARKTEALGRKISRRLRAAPTPRTTGPKARRERLRR